jgi:hypothetical protein
MASRDVIGSDQAGGNVLMAFEAFDRGRSTSFQPRVHGRKGACLSRGRSAHIERNSRAVVTHQLGFDDFTLSRGQDNEPASSGS